MKSFSRILITAGFCLGTLGAAGLSDPPQARAGIFFGAGSAALLAGGLLALLAVRKTRQARRSAGAEERQRVAQALESIRESIRAIESAAERMESADIHRRVDELIGGAFFELTSRHEELIQLLGFKTYARVWDGVAVAERLLNRCWSMLTDGWTDEALQELPRARAHIERSLAALNALERD